MVQRFLAENYAFESRRKILDSREGWSRDIWSKLAELGLLSLQVPEEQGGMAPAVVETLLTASATGMAMLLEPWVSSAIIGTVLIRELGSAQQREEMLVPMAAGERIAVPAHFEPAARKRWARCRPPSTRPSSTRRRASNSAFPSPGSRPCSIAWRTCSSMSSRRAR